MPNGPRVLVADDDPIARRFLESALSKAGYEATAVSTGDAAWQVLSSQEVPTIAVLDWMMPGLTGVELCEKVRAANLPVPPYLIVLTSRGETGDVVEALRAERVHSLEEALAHVQQLQGLIPICAWCRQVRNDGTFWEQVDSYLTKRSGLQFTHAICPTCRDREVAQRRRAGFRRPAIVLQCAGWSMAAPGRRRSAPRRALVDTRSQWPKTSSSSSSSPRSRAGSPSCCSPPCGGSSGARTGDARRRSSGVSASSDGSS